MQLVNKNGKAMRKDVVDLLHITAPQAYRGLDKLCKEGKLKLAGKGAGSIYTKP